MTEDVEGNSQSNLLIDGNINDKSVSRTQITI